VVQHIECWPWTIFARDAEFDLNGKIWNDKISGISLLCLWPELRFLNEENLERVVLLRRHHILSFWSQLFYFIITLLLTIVVPTCHSFFTFTPPFSFPSVYILPFIFKIYFLFLPLFNFFLQRNPYGISTFTIRVETTSIVSWARAWITTFVCRWLNSTIKFVKEEESVMTCRNYLVELCNINFVR